MKRYVRASERRSGSLWQRTGLPEQKMLICGSVINGADNIMLTIYRFEVVVVVCCFSVEARQGSQLVSKTVLVSWLVPQTEVANCRKAHRSIEEGRRIGNGRESEVEEVKGDHRKLYGSC